MSATTRQEAMTTGRHTAGPLEIWSQQSRTEIGGFYVIGQANFKGNAVAYVANRDDAQLYVAAPDMLVALQAIIDAYDRSNPMRTADFHNTDCGCLRCAVDAGRTALSTATGRETP
jgi:hypothetical protein